MRDAYTEWATFRDAARARVWPDYDHREEVVVAKVLRYLDFLRIIVRRFDAAAEVYLSAVRELQNSMHEGKNILNERQCELFTVSDQGCRATHLEIESFYMFGKVLLDRAANSIEFFLGPVRAHPLTSHDKLLKNIEGYARAKPEVLRPRLLELASILRESLVEMRDKSIVHDVSPRFLKSTLVDPNGNVALAGGMINSRPGDPHVRTAPPAALLVEMEEYLLEVLHVLQQRIGGQAREIR
jgi:hypothetical protein